MQNDLNLVYGCQLEVGESPIWDVKHDRLLFVDIRGCGVYHELPNTGKFQKIECLQQVGYSKKACSCEQALEIVCGKVAIQDGDKYFF